MKPFSRQFSLRLVLQLFVAILFLLPILWMVSASLKPTGALLPTRLQISTDLTLENFSRMWQLAPMLKYTLNSMLVITLAVPLTIITGSLVGFSISQLAQKNQGRWVIFLLFILMIPDIALWSSRFILYEAIGVYNSILALIAPSFIGTSPFYILIFYRAFRRIPYEVLASARLDGASVFDLWRLIALPIAKPTVLGVGFLTLLVYWGDYISPLLYLQTEKRYTLAIALQLLQQMDPSAWSLLMAAAVFMTAFPFILFLFVFTRLPK